MQLPAAPLRILFVNRMASMIRGGGETFDLEISRHLERLGVETSFLTGLPLWGRARLPLNRPRCHAIRTPYTGWLPWDRVRGGWRLRAWDFITFQNRAAKWAAARESDYDIIQVCELPHFVDRWKRLGCRAPVVMRLTAPNYYDPVKGIERADAVIASGTTIAHMRAGPRPDVYDIPNCVDTDHFKPGSAGPRKMLGIPESAFVLIYVARFLEFKRHSDLLAVFSRLLERVPNAFLLLAGSGPLEPHCREISRRLDLGDRVCFLGQIPYGDLPMVYSAADAGVIASNEHESFGFVALEAMASGLPVVSTACGMIPGLIEQSGGGAVVPVDKLDWMIEHLIRYASDPALRRTDGEKNREMVKRNYSWEVSAGKLLSVYEHLVACKRQ